MPLTQCPTCKSEVSDHAVSCPSCGHPLKTATTVEETGKRWKAIHFMGAFLLITGLLALGCAAATTKYAALTFFLGFLTLPLGILLLLVARIGTWWYHK